MLAVSPIYDKGAGDAGACASIVQSGNVIVRGRTIRARVYHNDKNFS